MMKLFEYPLIFKCLLYLQNSTLVYFFYLLMPLTVITLNNSICYKLLCSYYQISYIKHFLKSSQTMKVDMFTLDNSNSSKFRPNCFKNSFYANPFLSI